MLSYETQLFQTALERMPSDDHRIVIRADKTPVGEHARRFNAPTMDEVAIVIVIIRNSYDLKNTFI